MNPLNTLDAQARQEALDCQRSFIVQAPAGSGKTGLLTQRVLKLLAMVEEPEEVVAITFTRKAAAEMRGRILQALQNGSGDPPEKPHDRLTWQLAQQLLRHDQQKGWGIGHNPSRLRILTIDALCRLLVGQLPLVSGMGGEAGLLEDATPLYQQAARESLRGLTEGAAWGWAVRTLLEYLDNDRLKVENMLAQMLARRDQWLRHVVEKPNRQELEAALVMVVQEGLRECHQQFPPVLQQQVLPLAGFAAQQLAEQGNNSLAPLRNLAEFPTADPQLREQWLALSQLLLTAGGEWRRRLTVREGFPPQFKGEKAAMADLLDTLSLHEGLRQTLVAIRLLPPLVYGEEQWQVLRALITLLPLAVAQLWLLFSQHSKTDFSEISQRALLALGESHAPSDLALRLDYRLRHLLVDEFQDTSLPQFRLLERLTAGWSEGDGRTLFLVGDPMQSIYRFREADVGLFLRTRQQGVGSGFRIHPLTLQVNFRSCSQVVEWINGAFTHVLPQKNNLLTGAVSYAPSTPHQSPLPDPAGVFYHPLPDGSQEMEADCVVDLARQALSQDPLASVAILVRSRAHVPAILTALRKAEMAHHAVEIGRLSDSPVVQDLYSLTRLILQPAERLNWLAVFRSPCCGLSLADLTVLAPVDPQLPWTGEEEGLSLEGRARLQRVLPILHHFLSRRRRLPLRLLMEGCWLALGMSATVQSSPQWDDAMRYLELLAEMEEGGEIRDLEELHRRLTLTATAGKPGEGGGVQVMTIHKAKGLEFDCVILPGLARRPRQGETRLLHWQELSDRQDGLLLAPVRQSGQQREAISDYLRWLDRQKEELETGRLLYVAATRARRWLHLVATPRSETQHKPVSGSLLAALWEALSTMVELPETRNEEAPPPPSTQPPFYLQRLPLAWSPTPPPPWHPEENISPKEVVQTIDFEWAGEVLRLIGVVVHRMLCRLAQEGEQAWPPQQLERLRPVILTHLSTLGVPHSQMSTASQRILTALRATLQDERGRWLLFSPGEQELALTGKIQGQFRRVVIDRTFVTSHGIRWIVDYKTGYHAGTDIEHFLDNEQIRYQQQLENYARLFRYTEHRPIRLGLYFPLLGGWREWEYGEEPLPLHHHSLNK
ncbi:MAG: UvrD-helicase domain-containing protein [Magnetococcales bacterium]|nr:UvrD-helicase domain-containing protein [Magnetococcales bacterium]NGZ28325.1 UvrD-helicase domain-containing protein [Magnetococcales bacterium]